MYQLISKYKSLPVIFTFTNDDGVIFAGDCTNEAFVMDVCVCDQFTYGCKTDFGHCCTHSYKINQQHRLMEYSG